MGTTMMIMTMPLLFKDTNLFLRFFFSHFFPFASPGYREEQEVCSGQCFTGLAHRIEISKVTYTGQGGQLDVKRALDGKGVILSFHQDG